MKSFIICAVRNAKLSGLLIYMEAISYLYFLKCKAIPSNKIFHLQRKYFYNFRLLNKIFIHKVSYLQFQSAFEIKNKEKKITPLTICSACDIISNVA